MWVDIQYSVFSPTSTAPWAHSRRLDQMGMPNDTFWKRQGFWTHYYSGGGRTGTIPPDLDFPWWFDVLGMNRASSSSAQAAVPAWLVVIVAGVLPGWQLRSILHQRGRRRRRLRGCCPTCGYDLRATSELCPECGAEPGRG